MKTTKKKMLKKLVKKQEVKKGTPGSKKFVKVLKEYASGKLHSGSKKGPKVKKVSQARAIAFSEDRRANKAAKNKKK